MTSREQYELELKKELDAIDNQGASEFKTEIIIFILTLIVLFVFFC